MANEMAFNISKSIVLDIEKLITDDWTPIFKVFNFLRREVFYPIKLLIKGGDIFLRDIIKFSILSTFALIVLTAFTFDSTRPDREIFSLLLAPFAFFLPLAISMFSTPSSYSFCGVKDTHIECVMSRLNMSDIRSTGQLAAIKSNIQIFESRVKVRVIGLRAFMALSWTGFMYLNSEFYSNISAMGHAPNINDITFMSFVLMGIIGLYIAIESYSKANTLIFRAAILGCSEYEYMLAMKSTT